MTRIAPPSRHFGQLVVVLISLGLIFSAILPLGPGFGRMPGPDLLLATFLVWAIRRPDVVPVLLVAIVFFLADLILMRPPGLMAAAVVLATEYVKSRDDLTLEVPFLVEWTFASAVIFCVMIFTTIILMLFGSTGPAIGPLLIKMILTILSYPVIVGIARYLFGIDRPTRADDLGYRGGS